uniref:uncharacterized protein LOC122588718 n=1 Tax=Erigeron canadensis TaxID=72917 RepID=UPI001CB91A0A|nr:uncharacterized protein LOC122588718 [Erigeron canadensis]
MSAATIVHDDKAAEIEITKNKFDPELLKVSPADFKNLPFEQRRYWVYAHFLFRKNATSFKAKKLLSDDQLANFLKEEKEREEEKEKELNEEVSTKVPKLDDGVESGPRGVYWSLDKK